MNKLLLLGLLFFLIPSVNAINFTNTDFISGDGLVNVSVDNTFNYTADMISVGYDSVSFWNLSCPTNENFLSFFVNVTTSISLNENHACTIINMHFYDEITRLPINNVSFQLIGGDYANNYTTTTGNYTLPLFLGENEIVYWTDNYYLRKYFITTTIDSNVSSNLYLLNESGVNNQLVTYIMTDQDGNIIPGGILKALRRYVIGDAVVFEAVEMSKSDFNGEGGLHLELIDGTYKFFIEYNGNLILQTGETQIFSNEITLRSDLTSSVITSSVGTTELNVSFVFDESTLSLTTNYNDPVGITTQLCVRIDRIGQRIETVNSSCASGSVGSLVLGVPNSTGEYRVYAYQVTNTEYSDKPAGVFSITLSDVKEIVGVSGIFYLLMFTITGALIGMAVFGSAQHTISLAAIGFVFGILFKITEFGWLAGISTVVIAGFLVYLVKQKRVIGT